MKPGFPHKDTSWLLGLIAVRSALEDVKALATATPKLKTCESHGFQMADFSFLSWKKCDSNFAQWISKQLKTTVAYLWDEDTSGWFGYSIFVDGNELESYQFGANYEDELSEFAEELGEDTPTPEKKKQGWDALVSQDGEDFQFRSKVTKATEKDLLKGLSFVDARFRALDICIPEDFPEKQEAILVPLK